MTDEFHPLPGVGLPLFRCDSTAYAAFYAPGCLYGVSLANADRFQACLAQPEPGEDGAAELRRRAELAVAQDHRQRQEPFRPECLTLYLNNECNLRCVYCHTDPSPTPAARLELPAVVAAARVVAASCRELGRPFYAVFHGGGEPTLHRDRVERALTAVETVAREQGVELFRYVATNGFMSERKALWLAGCFDLIGLSCDGPAEVHDRQRPRWDGRPSLPLVERTAHILHEEGVPLHARTTITPASLDRQAEIADYLCQRIRPDEIHFEPVYQGGRTNAAGGLSADQADAFAAHFLAARRVAQGYGVPLLSSGSRPGAIHGPYCHVFRSVVNLVPGGMATACFKLTEEGQIREKEAVIGVWDRRTGRFEMDHDRVQALRQQLEGDLPGCADCFNRYHCARQCPDSCPLDGDPGGEPGFRCRAQKAIALGILRETADHVWAELSARQSEGPYGAIIL